MRSFSDGKIHVDGGQRRLIDLLAVQVDLGQLHRCHIRCAGYYIHRRFHRAAVSRRTDGHCPVYRVERAQRYNFGDQGIAIASTEFLLESPRGNGESVKSGAGDVCVRVSIQRNGGGLERGSRSKIARVNDFSRGIELGQKIVELPGKNPLESSLSREKSC